MSQVKIQGNASGTGNFTVTSPATNTDRTLTLPDETGTAATQSYVTTYASNASNLATGTVNTARLASGTPTAGTFLRGDQTWNGTINSGSAVATTSGTSVELITGIPSWVKRVTLVFNGVSSSGTSNYIVQLGTSGGYVTTGYSSICANGSSASTSSTAGFVCNLSTSNTDSISGLMTIATGGGNFWAEGFNGVNTNSNIGRVGGGALALGGALDRIRITTIGGTDTFDAGSITVMYEG